MVAIVARDKSDSKFGTRLKVLRLAAGLTQEELAKRVDMYPQHITRLENNGRSPSWETAVKLAEALGVSLDEFKTESE